MKRISTIFFLSLCILNSLLGQSENLIARWSFDEMTGIASQEEVSGKNFLIFSNWSPAEKIEGISGTALRIDGYSTWIESSMLQELPADSITISTWLAVQSYPTGFGGVFSRFDELSGKGIWLGLDRWGYLEAAVSVGVSLVKLRSEIKIERDSWQHVAFSINPSAGKAILFLNGSEIASQNIPNESIQFPTSKKILIGTHISTEKVGIFNKNMFNGGIDELSIYHRAFDENNLQTILANYTPGKIVDLRVSPERYETDPNRPIFHAIPDGAWTNEPHGLVYHEEKYHIFYQKNANGPYWSHINWGHMSSPDLISWEEEAISLWPEPGFDQEGIWSGTAIISSSGTPMIMYTGVNGAKAGVGIATSDDEMKVWDKYPGNPIISAPPATYTTRDFRDPFIWKEGDLWKMVIGSGIVSAGSGGALFLYESENLIDWQYLRAFHIGRPEEDDAGIFWEMPVVMPFENKYVVLVNKVPEPGRRAQALYWIGIIHNNRFIPDDIKPQKLEIINSLLAPTVTKDANGRYVAIGIIPDEVDPQQNYNQGWAHLYSLPRVWDLEGDSLLTQKPFPDLTKLRKNHRSFQNLDIAAGQEGFLTEVGGKHLEMKATIDPNGVREFGFYIRRSPDKSEQTKVYYDFNTQLFWVDRTRSSSNTNVPRNVFTGSYALPNDEPFELHMFIDGSVLEVFVDGKASFSTRIFPENSQSLGVDFYAKGGIALVEQLDVWDMENMNLVAIDKPIQTATNRFIQKAWPNPSSKDFHIQFKLDLPGNVKWVIRDLLGRKIGEITQKKYAPGLHSLAWNPLQYKSYTASAQFYMVQMFVNGVMKDQVKLLHHE